MMLAVLSLCAGQAFSQTPAGSGRGAGEIRVATFDYCPYVCNPDAEGGRLGIAVDVIKEIYEPLGYRLVFRNSNFKRALLSVEDGSFDIIPMLNPGNSKDIALSGSQWISLVQTFYVKKGSVWRYHGIASLQGRVTGSIVGYNYDSVSPEYERYLEAHHKENDGAVVYVASGDSILNVLKLMEAGRIDVFNEDSFTVDYLIAKHHLNGKFASAGVLGFLPQYTGFSRKNPRTPELIAAFDKGVRRIVHSGRFNDILLKYGLKPASQAGEKR
ncbi:substrate-binding periplasmic protein [Chromobacterium violaceum]|uniref:substrate-binding periplasmic protein n=1 Tax=Chromobacterium violaceum TaxID=536 RepID=UPI001C8C932F|nr:transporter substrate-binding domain-containing protein [Chromobacterium violaceum]MBX9269730.1 transporter substrate-binding domain-containing protein [Chromobacterium violaceum]